jgi:DNA-binding NarL/FixJ family response regulator
MRVLITDEQSLFREGLSLRLKKINQDIEILQSSDLSEMHKILSKEKDLDFLILDTDLMIESNITDFINKIKLTAPSLKIVAISSSEDSKNIKKILSFGVKGYIPKRLDGNILSGALKLILDGGTYLPPSLLENSIQANNSSGFGVLKKNLTNRQSQVLDLIAQGKSNKQIAYDMGVSEATVKLHINALLRSLKVNNRTQAVITAQKMGLI